MSRQSTSSVTENTSKTILWGKGKTVPSKGGMGLLVNCAPDVGEPTSLPTPRCLFLHVGGELNQDKQICTFKPQAEKDSCKLLLSTVGVSPGMKEGWDRSGSLVSRGNSFLPSSPSQICLGEKAKEEVNRVEILPPANQEDRKSPVTIASLKASVLPMVSLSLRAQGSYLLNVTLQGAWT